MRLIKTFGLAAIVAVAAMAFIGASSASAGNTAICKTNEGGALTCAEANQWKKVHAVATDMVFLSSVLNILCESSLLQTALLALGAPQVGHNESLTWSGCKTESGTLCTVTTTSLGLLLLLKTTTNLGFMQFHGMELFIKCGAFIECLYKGLPEFHLLGSSSFGDSPNNGGFRGKESALTSSSDGLCPEVIILDIFWEALEAVYIKS